MIAPHRSRRLKCPWKDKSSKAPRSRQWLMTSEWSENGMNTRIRSYMSFRTCLIAVQKGNNVAGWTRPWLNVDCCLFVIWQSVLVSLLVRAGCSHGISCFQYLEIYGRACGLSFRSMRLTGSQTLGSYIKEASTVHVQINISKALLLQQLAGEFCSSIVWVGAVGAVGAWNFVICSWQESKYLQDPSCIAFRNKRQKLMPAFSWAKNGQVYWMAAAYLWQSLATCTATGGTRVIAPPYGQHCA